MSATASAALADHLVHALQPSGCPADDAVARRSPYDQLGAPHSRCGPWQPTRRDTAQRRTTPGRAPTGPACSCTSSAARAAPARRRSPPRSRSRSPPGASTCCSARSRAARASPSSSTSRRCPTRSAASRRARTTAATSTRSPSTPSPRCWSTSTLYYRLGNRTGRALDRFGVIDFATTIAPGLRDVLLTGKVYEAVERNSRNKNARVYDAVVLDAPPTGRIAQFLNVNGEFGDLARVGTVKGQTERVMRLLKSRRTAVHLVTVLEDMPVQETADGIERAARPRPPGRRRGGQPDPARGARRRGARRRARRRARRASDRGRPAQGRRRRRRRPARGPARRGAGPRRAAGARGRAARRGSPTLGVPTYELQRLADGIDLGGLYELAADLREQGMA